MLQLQPELNVKGASSVSLTVGQVARAVGIRPSALRYYEARGVLRPRGRLPNGYRVYAEQDVAQLRFVRHAQSFGLTLVEIKELLGLYSRGRRPCSRVQELARAHLRDVEARMVELEALRRDLRSLVRGVEEEARGGEVCPIIERPGMARTSASRRARTLPG